MSLSRPVISGYLANLRRNTAQDIKKEYTLNQLLSHNKDSAQCKVYKATKNGETVVLKRRQLNGSPASSTNISIEKYKELEQEAIDKNLAIATESYIAGMILRFHPNIVILKRTFLTTANEIVMEMEFMQLTVRHVCETLHGKLEIHQIRSTVTQILKALYYCHSRGIIHGDVKLDNMLVNYDGVVKLADFGSARILPQGVKYIGPDRHICPQSYEPPEVIAHQLFGVEVDIWALACCIVAMYDVTKIPFINGTDQQRINNINEFCLGPIPTSYFRDAEGNVNPKVDFPTTDNMGPLVVFGYMKPHRTLLHLVTKMFYADPVKRPTAASALIQPFLVTPDIMPSEKPFTLGAISNRDYLNRNKHVTWNLNDVNKPKSI